MDGAARFPFAFGWYGSELPGYRPCDDTYCFFPYADLPPLDAPGETLDWLGPLDEATDRKMQVYRDRTTAPGRLEEIEAAPPPAAGPVSPVVTDGRDRPPAREGDGGGAAMTRVLGLIGVVLGVAIATLGALPSGWLGGLNGVGGSGHLRADALVAAGVVLLLLGIVGLVRPPAATGR